MLTKPTLLGHFASVLLLCSSSMVAMATDETEPNNDKSTTNEIAVGGNLNGKISSVSDTDWFKLTGIQAGNSYEIKAINVGRDLDVALELFRDETPLDSSNSGLEGENENIQLDEATAGDYRVRVRQTGFWGVDTVYTVTLTDITKPKEAGSITLITDTISLTNVVAGTTPTTVEFQLLNSEGKPAGMGDKSVTFTLTGPTGWTSPTLSNTTKTSTDGKFTFDWKDANGDAISFTKADTYTLEASAEGQNKSVTLTIIPATPAKLTWVGDTGTTQPIEVPTYIATQPLTFEVRDQYENLVTAGQTIEVQIIKPDGTPMAPDSSSMLTTDANGQVKVVFTPDQAGKYTIKAPSSSTEVMSSLPMLVGEATDNKSPITFTLTDKNGKGIDRQQIEVSSQPVADILESSGVLTTKDGGKVTVSLKGDTVPGDYTVSAKLSSSKATNSDVYAVNNEVKVSVAATAPDSLTVKGGETQTISSDDTASAQITFELKAGGNPIGGTLEVTLSKEPDKHKACLVDADTAVCDANNLVTTLSVTTDAISGEGSVWLKDAKLAGEYTITATLQDSKSPLTKQVQVTVNAGAPNLTVGKDKLSRQVQHLTLAEASKASEIVFNLTDKNGNAVAGQVNFNIEPTPAEASTPPAEASTPVVCLGIDADKPCTEDNVSTATVDAKTGQVKVFLKGLEIGEYTVVATLGNTEVKAKAEVVVEVGNLAVTEGGNQTIVVPQSPFEGTVINKSTVITFTLKDGAGVDEISKPGTGKEVDGKTVTLTLTDDSLGNPVTGLGLVEEGKTDGTPQKSLPLSTNANGEVKIIFQAPAIVVPDPVTTYKITAEVNGLKEYTEVFVVAKKVSELVGEGEGKIWPSLDQGEQLKKRQATATECEGKGWAWNASGKPVTSEATFYGGLKKGTGTEAFQVKIDGDGKVVAKTVDENNHFVEGTGDPVVVQGVIKVDQKDKKDVAGLFVLGENEFTEKFGKDQKDNNLKGLYMLGRPFGYIPPLDSTKMLEELIAFRRNVTPDQDDYILLEMYRGAFYYPGTLKVFFGYYTKDGTIVHNCTPIEVQISE